jgi:nitroimidazol reductase NimA-like FMN-containing flavoprotein (pyridoxamine 5'-phosphate oxidase superfamily)
MPGEMSKRLDDRTGLIELDREECLDLLRQANVGRIGVTIEALPVILPVNYVLIDDCIVFRTVAGTKLAAATRHAIVAFEVDSYDLDGVAGWRVLAVGRSALATDPTLVEKAQAASLEPWAVHHAPQDLVQVETTRLTGRRFDNRPPPEPAGEAAFRSER